MTAGESDQYTTNKLGVSNNNEQFGLLAYHLLFAAEYSDANSDRRSQTI